MDEIKLYWSTSLQNGRKNFGDWLSPVLCEALSGRKVVHARPNKCDLMALGSILAKAKNHFWNRRIDIWGSGLIEDIAPFSSPHRIHAVRGWKTAEHIKNQKVTVVGDPGLLCNILISEKSVRRKKYSIGLIPHYVDQENPFVDRFISRYPDSHMIDVFSDTLDFIEQVASCEFVLSSSLHGLITADSLGVPNTWMRLSGKVWGKDFKFYDYYSVFGFEPIEPFSLTHDTSESEILSLADDYCRPGIGKIKNDLLNSFPFKQ